ncbi:zinc finger BED domain-containing protein DAYSLEEPER-like [Prosopis cineraria]|uniref:zinc finger BED domain-containing protein DAYSLEEPER-like n=1 Tax=Prosopis cineraria TaxID=364024 RepID=UPI00241096BD|nr:zinc finger BED domain-containing protein DAYSLEEPER-like [Prosopis cineraria]
MRLSSLVRVKTALAVISGDVFASALALSFHPASTTSQVRLANFSTVRLIFIIACARFSSFLQLHLADAFTSSIDLGSTLLADASTQMQQHASASVDNASSNDFEIVFLKKRLKDLGGLVCDGEFLQMRLKKFKELIEKLRIDSKSLLTMDCPTRWNSTYIMLQNAKFTKVIDRMEDEDQDYKNYFKKKVKLSSSSSFIDRMEEEDEDELGDHDGDKGIVKPPNAYDWSMAKEFLTFLELFYTMTLQFFGSNYVTSNTCFQNIVAIKTRLDSIAVESNSLLSDMVERMQSKYDKYWGKAKNMNLLLVIAVILDPRYKFSYVEVAFKHFIGDYTKREMMKKKIMRFLHRLFDEYFVTLAVSGNEPSETGIEMGDISSSGGGKQVPPSSKKIIDVAIQDFLATVMSKRPKKLISEVEEYLNAELVDACDDSFDILAWWKVNSSKYKVLGLITRDLLAIPVSIVSLEFAFSTGG